MHFTYLNADKIYLKSPDSKWVIPKMYHNKVSVSLEIGCDNRVLNHSRNPDKYYRVLFVGRFIYWKGIYIVLDTIKKLKPCHDIKFTLVGSGPDSANLRNYIRLNSLDCVDVINWVDQYKLKEIYSSHDLLFFPSLHDSSGNVILEAMAHSLPILALDLGGPGYILRDTCMTLIDPTISYKHVVHQCAEAILSSKTNPDMYKDLKPLYNEILCELSWSNAVDRIYAYL
jgi:glycosyltransferase involved in cell wall biosynthesis